MFLRNPQAVGNDMTETAAISSGRSCTLWRVGFQVATFGQEIAITHYYNSGTGIVGEAYVFGKVGTTWQLEARLNASDKTNEQADAFGLRLAFNGTTVVIGAPLAQSGRAGRVFVFEKPTAVWVNMTQTAILQSSDNALYSQFGTSVDIYQNTIIVGRLQSYNRIPGAAYVFE